MNAQQLLGMIKAGQMSSLEAGWMQAMEGGLPAADLGSVLEALVKAGQLDRAEAFAQLLLEDRAPKSSPEEMIPVVQAVVSAVPMSDELRAQAAAAYTKAHATHPNFQAMLTASGLLTGQSPRRAFRTLDTCLAIVPGDYLANRFDGRVLRAEQYDNVMDEFEAKDARGATTKLEPKKLADEFERVDENDFRVLHQHRPGQLTELLQADPAVVLIGICMSVGGHVDANALRDMLVPAHMDKAAWSAWWNKARTAAKRSEQLSLEGRSPIVVSYHPSGRTLEEELAPTAKAANLPLEKLSLLQQYLREVRARKLKVDDRFVKPILESLAEQVVSFAARRPTDGLAAALALEVAADAGLPAAAANHPTAGEILSIATHPANAVANLGEPSLFSRALDALMKRPDGADQLIALLPLTAASQLDELAGRLAAAGRTAALNALAAEAIGDPLRRLEAFVWLWKGPEKAPEGTPSKTELLRRLLIALRDLDHDWDIDPTSRKEIRQRIRSAISANDFASFKQALGEMDEAVAGTIKHLIERTEGLAEAVHDGMINQLRERFYGLFLKAKVDPWLDENSLYTTEDALHKREDELKFLVDVKMFENAKAIGAAAEHGDLSENSEWKFALEERDLLRARAAKMQEELAKARVIRAENVPTDIVGVGAKVKLTRVSDGQQVELSFLGPWDSDLENRVYSYQTPLAQAMMGKPPGSVVTVKIDGQEGEYRIEQLSCAVS